MTDENTTAPAEEKASLNFIHQIIEEEVSRGKNQGRVHTRFPPEPNGYLHIGHAKSICLNFGTARKYNGLANLRFDDTNPVKEDTEYVDSIMEDVRWLGFDWDDRLFYASDYFDQLYDWAVKMILEGKAYVDDLNAEQISEYRGTVTRAGKESPYRTRTPEENLDLFTRMKNGEFPDGSRVLRAKIDMAHPNMLMRDPIMYRILHTDHHRTGNKWCIYPMYDYAHGQSDYLEGITHSICTLEFEVHRPLYEWYLDQVAEGDYRPRQIEFARLNLTYTVMSKRKLLQLVNEKVVTGWDDPRMPTICGLRRRGYTPESLRNFADTIGIAKRDQLIDVALLEFCVREDLNKRSNRVMTVLNPVKLILDNYPEGQVEELEAINNPEDPEGGYRKVQFSRELYIEREDFMENPEGKFFRLKPGGEVRLKYGYIIKCESIVKDNAGNITEIHCTYQDDTRSGRPNSNKKVKGTLHWVSVAHAVPVEVRLYDRLFATETPENVEEGHDFKENLNPDSLKVITAYSEASVSSCKAGDRFQFERLGYFCVDPETDNNKIVFNRTVALKDPWTKSKQG
jgi:glutaminyl-tRNA synthetase